MGVLLSTQSIAATRKPVPASASSAKAFIEGVYKDYERTQRPPSDSRVFTPELASLLARDGAIASKQGEPNLIDYVVLCSCQDDEGMRFTTSIVSASASAAVIRVTTAYKNTPAKNHPSFNLRLTRTAAGWRVADVITPGKYGGSLLATLKKGLASAADADATNFAGAADRGVQRAPAALPASIEYAGFTGSDRYPVYNNLKLAVLGGNLSGSGYIRLGIFDGSAPLTGAYANGECTVVRKKQTYRGACDANGFSGVIYDGKGKPGDRFEFRSAAALAQGGPAASPASYVAASAAAPAASVWALGRVRILTERDGRCGLDASLGQNFCFDRAITWLRQRPKKNEIDVIAMDNAYVPGSMVPYDSGRGWQVFRVARSGDGFGASKQRHFTTRVQPPPGCIYKGVIEEAWYITVAGGRKVAVEAVNYSCAAWNGPGIYTQSANYADVDAGRLDYAGGSTDYRASHPDLSGPVGQTSSTFGQPRQPTYGRGDSTNIYGSPDLSPPARKPKRKR